MIRAVLAVLVVIAVQPTFASPANAGCEYTDQVRFIDGVAVVDAVMICDEDDGAIDQVSNAQPTNMNLDTNCVRFALSQDEDPLKFCDIPAEAAATIQLTPDMVASAFARIPLPPSKLVVQPPNGRTLVNFE
ncbi:MAG: hypothetical protein M3237_07870, partial [Actinomycetota bacterium]|nr:hypothetical protein [Actinomycetota bacterium]